MATPGEAAAFCRIVGGLSPPQLAALFAKFNRGVLESFLIEITAQIYLQPDERVAGGALVDAILDSTGSKGTGKWTIQQAAELGVSFHVGSQCMAPAAYRAAMMEASRLIARAGVTVDIVDVGGGFPSVYPGLVPPPLEDYVSAIESAFEDMMVLENADLWCEPGRALIAEAVSVLTRVELVKGDAVYMNDGSYGTLFDMVHARWPFPMRVHRAGGEVSEQTAEYRLYGPTCDSIDSMPGPYTLPADIREGDVIEFGMLGAYGTAMATRFNGFGDVDTVKVNDFPWVSLYDQKLVRPARREGSVVPFARVRRRRQRLLKKR